MSLSRKLLGKEGEEAAANFLVDKGYILLERNFSFTGGEIDLIARLDDRIHFIEVKTRKTVSYGTPAMAVNSRKQEKIIKTAKYYLTSHKIYDAPCSFDVIEVFKFCDNRVAVRLIENAFEE